MPEMTDLILNLAPTGMIAKRENAPRTPLTPKAIIDEVLQCAEQGITIAHLHARDDAGRATTDADIYARIIAGIREQREDLVLCVSCSGRNGESLQQRSSVLNLPDDLRPDMASLTLSSLNFVQQASINTPDTIEALAERMGERGIKPELELFDLGMINYASYLLQKGLLRSPLYSNLFFGNIASAQATLPEIAAMTGALPPETTWSLAGIGPAQRIIAPIAVALGDGIRIGLEDNLWFDADRKRPWSNPEMVDWVHNLAGLNNRRIMSPQDFRRQQGLL